MMHTHERSGCRRRCTAAILLLVASGLPALGQVKTWTGVGGPSGSWDSANGWTPAGQPDGGDEVLIALPGANVTYANTTSPEVVLARLNVGAPGGIATLSQGQHDLNTSRLEVGGAGNGAIVQSGGRLNVRTPDGAILGDLPGSIGNYAISGTAELNVAGQFIVGDVGLATVTQSGGAVRVTTVGQLPGTLVVGSNLTSAGSYTMGGGTVEAPVLQLSPFGGVATFNQSAGQVTASQELILGDLVTLEVAGSALYNHVGGSLATPATIIGATGTLKHSGGVYRTNSLTIDITGNPDDGGKVDLTNQNLVINYAAGDPSPLQSIRGYVRSGYNGGDWNGTGIISSSAATTAGSAVGYAEAADVLGLSGNATMLWNGQVVDASSVLVDFTRAGDANVDGSVSFEDLVRLAQNYNDMSGAALWSEGDFNYDGNVAFEDLVLLAQNYGQSLPAALMPGASASFHGDLARAMAHVPEPGSLVVVCINSWGAASRRKRHLQV